MKPSSRAMNIADVRRVCTAIPIVVVLAGSALGAYTVRVISPDGKVRCEIMLREQGRLMYRVNREDKPVIEASPMVILLDDINLSQDVDLGEAETFQINEKYPWRGVHSQAINHCNGAKIPVTH